VEGPQKLRAISKSPSALQSLADYVIETVAEISAEEARLSGYRIVWKPAGPRHFTAGFAPIV
jgi:hypothetical protein